MSLKNSVISIVSHILLDIVNDLGHGYSKVVTLETQHGGERLTCDHYKKLIYGESANIYPFVSGSDSDTVENLHGTWPW